MPAKSQKIDGIKGELDMPIPVPVLNASPNFGIAEDIGEKVGCPCEGKRIKSMVYQMR